MYLNSNKILEISFLLVLITAVLPVDFLPVFFSFPLVRIFESIFLILLISIEVFVNRWNNKYLNILKLFCVIFFFIGLFDYESEFFNFKILVLDTSVLAGLVWGLRYKLVLRNKFILNVYRISYVSFIIGSIGLYSGFLVSTIEARDVLLPMFISSFIFLTVGQYLLTIKSINKKYYYFGILLVLLYAIMSATRNLILLIGLLGLLNLKINIKYILLSVLIYFGLSISADFLIFNRFSAIDFENESRFIELLMLFEDFNSYLFGVGLGHGGYKPTLSASINDILVPYAHISIASLYYKTGVALILIFLTTLFKSFFVKISFNNSFRIMLILTLFQMSISGGYSLLYFFILGISINAIWREKNYQ